MSSSELPPADSTPAENQSPGAPRVGPSRTAGRARVLEDRLRSIVESAPVGLMAISEEGQILAVNQEALSLLGARRSQDLLHVPFTTFLPPDSVPTWTAFVSHSFEGGGEVLRCDVVAPGMDSQTIEARARELPRQEARFRVLLCALWPSSHASAAEARAIALASAMAETEAVTAQLQGEREELLAERESLQQVVDTLGAEVAAARRDKDDLQASLAAQVAEASRLELAREEARSFFEARLAEQTAEGDRLNGVIRDLTERVHAAEREQAAEGDRLNEVIRDLIERADAAERERDTARETLSETVLVVTSAAGQLENLLTSTSKAAATGAGASGDEPGETAGADDHWSF